ncbi:MAG: thymidine phosphorylase [Anaerolineae bacterium]|nr:thymidine phosphorylase [Anaerolineae bacterium]
MRIIDVIIKKRDKKELSKEEIDFFIKAYTRGDVPDYQASAWAMAVLLNGMTVQEMTDLTMAMANSGDTLDLTGVVDLVVDKHSTGGVGDKTTLAVEPIVTACGLPMGKMSGHGLGFSGGTLDKMESIPGYRTDLSSEEFLQQLKTVGIVLTGQTGDLAPADGKMYALRDVTGTVPSLPLIASSIMSKKIAAGAQRILLDVKIGSGAFMRTLEDARQLAEIMVNIGKLAGRQTAALLSDMNQPLGFAVGNILEVKEAIETLQGGGPEDFRGHVMEVVEQLLLLGGAAEDESSARQMAQDAISSGKAFAQFKKLVEAQGGDVSYIENPDKFPAAEFIETVTAERGGYLSGIEAQAFGEMAVQLGAGRLEKGDPIDHTVGIVVHRKVGDKISAGDALFTIHANSQESLAEARQPLVEAHSWSDTPVEALPLFYGLVK